MWMRIATRLPRRVLSCKNRQLPQHRTYATPIEYDPRPREPDPQLNGYPELPYVNLQHRPPLGWWDVQGRRNFGETLHEEQDLLDMWSPDVSNIPASSALKQVAIVALGFTGFGYFVYKFKPDAPAVPREYPFSGLIKELGGLEENKAPELLIEDE